MSVEYKEASKQKESIHVSVNPFKSRVCSSCARSEFNQIEDGVTEEKVKDLETVRVYLYLTARDLAASVVKIKRPKVGEKDQEQAFPFGVELSPLDGNCANPRDGVRRKRRASTTPASE